MRIEAARRPGRSHRRNGIPCQDAHATWSDPDGGRAALAVADGLGSKPLSQHGSQAACDAAIAHLASAPSWDAGTLRGAMGAAEAAVRQTAHALQANAADLATTLQLAVWDRGTARVAMLGDGAVVGVHEGQARVLVGPPPGQYANEVVPLTHTDWPEHVQESSGPCDGPLLAFSDGLVRLLLEKPRGRRDPGLDPPSPEARLPPGPPSSWRPHAPFFAAFLPRLAESGVVQRFLEGDDVDAAWDDDKCLVVVLPDGR